MSLVTYTDQSPEFITEGDRVIDSYGRDYIAQTTAEKDWTGDFMVRDPDMRWISYSTTDRVTLEFEQSEEYV